MSPIIFSLVCGVAAVVAAAVLIGRIRKQPAGDEKMQEIEKALIVKALRQAAGVQKLAAETLGIKPRSLWHRVRKFGVDVAALKNNKK